jgi:hypothetical protein
MIVPLVGLKWIRVTTYMAREAMDFFWQIMGLSMENINKQILVYRTIDIVKTTHQKTGRGPVDTMLRIIKDYGMMEYVTTALETGVFMSQSQWKRKVKEKIIEKEHQEWTATGFMYRGAMDFKKIGVDINMGWGGWQIARWNSSMLKNIKYMWNILNMKNEKCGHMCKCEEKPNIAHVIFKCEIVNNTRRQKWIEVKNIIPQAMVNSIEAMTPEERITFIYSCLHGLPIMEWMSVYIALSKFVVEVGKEWYSRVTVEVYDDGG